MHANDANELPNDVDALRAMVVAMQQKMASDEAELKKERAKYTALDQLYQVLLQQLAVLRRARFGRQSEKLDAQLHQLELQIEDLESAMADIAPIPEPAQEEKKTPAARKPLPASLPRDIIEYGKQSCCSDCGNELLHIGDDISEQLEYIPASFRVIKHVRPKYSCRSCNVMTQAPAPSRPIARGYAGPGLLAHVIVSKFVDHLPLYRQSQIYTREGVELERSTLADWVGQVFHLLRPLNNALNEYVMAATKLHTDDTPVPVLQPGRKTTKQGRLWGYLRDDRPAGNTDAPAVWFSYSPDRKGKWPEEHLSGYSGTLQADGYAGYKALYAKEDIHEAACWAHVRRKFYDIDQVQPDSFAAEVLEAIADLYVIEKQIKGKPPDLRLIIRQEQAKPRLDQLKEKLRQTLSRVAKKLPLAKAIKYALVRWDALELYTSNGAIEIDNNPIEREIRPIALGRKNYLFAGSDAGGERAAMMYSLMNTAKLNGIEPEAYLTHVLRRIADYPVNRVDELLPWNVQLDTTTSS